MLGAAVDLQVTTCGQERSRLAAGRCHGVRLTGGDGVISAVANVAPQLCRGMYYATRKGCPRYATTISDMLMPLAEIVSPEQVSSVVKYALSLRGLGSSAVRLPRMPVDEAGQHVVQMAMQAIWASPDEVMPRAI